MKVLFVVKSKKMQNLGVMYLSAIAKQYGHESYIVDIDNAAKYVMENKPDVVGYSIMTGSQIEFKGLNKFITIQSPDVITFAGGPHPTFFPDDENLKGINHIVRGEAEGYMANFFSGHNSLKIEYCNLDNIPWPDRTDFPNMKIQDFIASRGCVNSCKYCYNDKWNNLHPEFENKVRTRNPKDVCDEIENVFPNFVYFQDSCFALNMDWFREFAKIYANDLAIPYHCHMRPGQLINEERINLLMSSGCESLRMALESGSERLRTLMGRPKLDTNNIIRASQLLKKYHIKFMIQNILAVPTSTIEDDLLTLEYNIKCKPDYAWSSIFVPYPGTILGDQCKSEGWYSGNYEDIQDSFFEKSVLNFDQTYKEQTYVLQKIFALCVETGYIPDPSELYVANMPKLTHNIMRYLGDRRMYENTFLS